MIDDIQYALQILDLATRDGNNNQHPAYSTAFKTLTDYLAELIKKTEMVSDKK